MIDHDDDALLASLRTHEGYRAHPYRCTAGRWTIGYGRNLDAVGITGPEANLLLEHDALAAMRYANDYAWFARLSDARQRVVVEMIFQLGPRGFGKFKRAIANMAVGNHDAAADEMLDSKWAKRDSPARASVLASRYRAG